MSQVSAESRDQFVSQLTGQCQVLRDEAMSHASKVGIPGRALFCIQISDD